MENVNGKKETVNKKTKQNGRKWFEFYLCVGMSLTYLEKLSQS